MLTSSLGVIIVWFGRPADILRETLMRGVQFKLCELDKMPLLSSEMFWNN